MKNKKEKRIVFSKNNKVRDEQFAEYTKKFCEEHKELIDALAEGGSDEEEK